MLRLDGYTCVLAVVTDSPSPGTGGIQSSGQNAVTPRKPRGKSQKNRGQIPLSLKVSRAQLCVAPGRSRARSSALTGRAEFGSAFAGGRGVRRISALSFPFLRPASPPDTALREPSISPTFLQNAALTPQATASRRDVGTHASALPRRDPLCPPPVSTEALGIPVPAQPGFGFSPRLPLGPAFISPPRSLSGSSWRWAKNKKTLMAAASLPLLSARGRTGTFLLLPGGFHSSPHPAC